MPWTLSQVIFHPWQFLASACSLSAPAQGCPGKGTEVRPLSSPTGDLSQVVGGKSQRGDDIVTPVFITIVTVAVSPLSQHHQDRHHFPHHGHRNLSPPWPPSPSPPSPSPHHPYHTIITFTIAIMAIATTITSTITPSMVSITAYQQEATRNSLPDCDLERVKSGIRPPRLPKLPTPKEAGHGGCVSLTPQQLRLPEPSLVDDVGRAPKSSPHPPHLPFLCR